MGPPNEGAVDAMQQLSKMGHQLIIHTCRGGNPKHVEDWLKWYKIPFESVTNIKPFAAFYIDDRAIKHINWKQTLKEIHAPEAGLL